jgi:hypothetical protein
VLRYFRSSCRGSATISTKNSWNMIFPQREKLALVFICEFDQFLMSGKSMAQNAATS